MLTHPLGHSQLWRAAGLPRASGDTARVALSESPGGRELLCCPYLRAVSCSRGVWGQQEWLHGDCHPGSWVGAAAEALPWAEEQAVAVLGIAQGAGGAC